MRFISGLFAGATLTSTVLYFSLAQHKRNRLQQSQHLRQQALLLHSIVDPGIVPIEDAPRRGYKPEGWTEDWKERWNTRVEKAVKWAHTVTWRDVQSSVMSKVDGLRSNDTRS